MGRNTIEAVESRLDYAQSLCGTEAGGRDDITGLPRGQEMTEGGFRDAVQITEMHVIASEIAANLSVWAERAGLNMEAYSSVAEAAEAELNTHLYVQYRLGNIQKDYSAQLTIRENGMLESVIVKSRDGLPEAHAIIPDDELEKIAEAYGQDALYADTDWHEYDERDMGEEEPEL